MSVFSYMPKSRDEMRQESAARRRYAGVDRSHVNLEGIKDGDVIAAAIETNTSQAFLKMQEIEKERDRKLAQQVFKNVEMDGLDVEFGPDGGVSIKLDEELFQAQDDLISAASIPPFFILAVDGTDVDIGSGPIMRIRGAALSEFKVWGGDTLSNGLPKTANYRIYGLQFNLQQSIGAGNPEINASADHGDCSSVDNCWSDLDQGIKSSNNATGQADNDHFVTIPIGYADQDGILAQWQRDQILLPVYG